MRVKIKSNTILSGEDVRNVIDDLARKGIYTQKIVCYLNCVDSNGKHVCCDADYSDSCDADYSDRSYNITKKMDIIFDKTQEEEKNININKADEDSAQKDVLF